MKLKPLKFEVSLRKERSALLAGWLLAVAVPQAQAADQTAATAKLEVNLKAKFVEYDQTNGAAEAVVAGMTKAAPTALYTYLIGTELSILSGGQFTNVLNALERLDGTDVLTPPEVTTESGREAQMQAFEVRYLDAATARNWTNTDGWSAGGGAVGEWTNGPTNVPITATRALGPEAYVMGEVGDDKSTIELATIMRNFISNNIPGLVVAGSSLGGVSSSAGQPRQHYWWGLNEATIWDGQTMAITGLKTTIDGSYTTTNDARKNLIVFVTATIVNADGTAYHTDEERTKLQTNAPPPQERK